MIYIKLSKDNTVNSIDYRPFDDIYGLGKTKEELEKEGMFVDSIPEATVQVGKISVLKIKTDTKELYYEYIDIPKAQEQILQENINALGQTIAQEKIKNMQNDTTIAQLGQELAKVKLELIQLKGGK